jgi:hypothetical protein
VPFPILSFLLNNLMVKEVLHITSVVKPSYFFQTVDCSQER